MPTITGPTIIQSFNRPEYRERTALISQTQTWTYGEVAEKIEGVAAALAAQGVKKGDRVGIYMVNSLEMVLTIFATWRLGGIVLFLDIYDPPTRSINWCNVAEAKVIVWDEGRLEATAQYWKDLKTVEKIISSGKADPANHVLPWSTLGGPHQHPPAPQVEMSGEDIITIIQSSGTTSMPKGICISLAAYQSRLESHKKAHPYFPEDTICPMSPLSTVAGINVMTLPALAVGAKVVLLANSHDPVAALEQIAATRSSVVMAGPARIHGFVEAVKKNPQFDISALRFMMTGGDTLKEELRREWDKTIKAPLLEGYGLSETLAGVVINRPGENHYNNVGREFPGVEIEIRDEDGHKVPDGEVGELWAKADFFFSHYWKQPELTARALQNGWLKSNDDAVRLPDGTYRILGRRDFIIMRGTVNISPVEIEAGLMKHPAVVDCMVAPVPHPVLGQDLEAFLVLREPIGHRELHAYFTEKLGPTYCPSKFYSVPEIYKTKQDKVDRRGAEKLRAAATLLT
jgi:acyl-CoA synthetase (AMP-forming)/AMP-acid ligase II